MYTDGQMYQYLQSLHAVVESQNKKIKQLNKDIKEIEIEINKLKQTKSVNVEKIEYKFDQLKVERLEGTLNIGITPNGTGAIEEYTVEGKTMEDVTFPVEKKYREIHAQIEHLLEEYIDKDLADAISKIENLNKDYKHLIINDIKKQLNQRIQLYLNQMGKNVNINDATAIQESIFNSIKNDITQGIEYFLKNLPKKENDV